MTSAPDQPGAKPKVRRGPNTASARTRRYIADFGPGRRCVVAGCKTVLSRYHRGGRCWVHDDSPPKR